MTQRLPTPGGDNNTWGDILNDFLEVSLNGDGTLANNTVGTNQLQNNAVTNAQLDTNTQQAITKANSSIQTSQLGVASGVAQLDTNSTLKTSQIPGSVASATSPYAYVDAYGADPTGTVDSTSAFEAAKTTGLQVVLGKGTYKLGTSVDLSAFGRKQGIIGPGSELCSIVYIGNGTALTFFDSSYSQAASEGGRIGGFSLNGYSAGVSANGLLWGDLGNGRAQDVGINGFGGIGLHFQNVAGHSEDAEWTAIKIVQCGQQVVFDTGSFDYSVYQFVLAANANQNGLDIINGASLYGVRLEARGNFSRGTTNTAYAFGMDVTGSGGSSIHDAAVDWNVEIDGSGTAHTTIVFGGSGTSTQFSGHGVLAFSGTGWTGANFTNSQAILGFGGRIQDPNLGTMTPNEAHASYGGTQLKMAGSNTSAIGSANQASTFTFYLNAADIFAEQLKGGASYTFTFSGTPNKLSTIKKVYLWQPSSGTAVSSITWPSNIHWVNGTPTLTTTLGNFDAFELVWLPAYGSGTGAWVGTHLGSGS